jgi:lysophospholipase L1-like esterase
LAVGGSTTFGHDLADDETWPYLLERRLHEAGFEAEVINGGVPGWGAEQCRIRLQRDLGWIEPDLVLLYTGWNWPRVDLQRSFNPFPYHAGLIDWLPLWMLETRTVLKLAKLANKMGGRPSRVAAQEAPRIQDDRYREGLVQELDQIGLQLRELGVPAFVVKFPAVIAPQPAADEQAELRTVEALLRHRWPRPADSTAQIAVEVREKLAQARTALEQDRGVQVLDVARVFDRLTPEQRAPLFLDRAHLTKAGNERLATALFEALRGAVENWEKLLRR